MLKNGTPTREEQLNGLLKFCTRRARPFAALRVTGILSKCPAPERGETKVRARMV